LRGGVMPMPTPTPTAEKLNHMSPMTGGTTMSPVVAVAHIWFRVRFRPKTHCPLELHEKRGRKIGNKGEREGWRGGGAGGGGIGGGGVDAAADLTRPRDVHGVVAGHGGVAPRPRATFLVVVRVNEFGPKLGGQIRGGNAQMEKGLLWGGHHIQMYCIPNSWRVSLVLCVGSLAINRRHHGNGVVTFRGCWRGREGPAGSGRHRGRRRRPPRPRRSAC